MESYESRRNRQRRWQIAKEIVVDSLATVAIGIICFAWIIICACW